MKMSIILSVVMTMLQVFMQEFFNSILNHVCLLICMSSHHLFILGKNHLLQLRIVCKNESFWIFNSCSGDCFEILIAGFFVDVIEQRITKFNSWDYAFCVVWNSGHDFETILSTQNYPKWNFKFAFPTFLHFQGLMPSRPSRRTPINHCTILLMFVFTFTIQKPIRNHMTNNDQILQ